MAYLKDNYNPEELHIYSINDNIHFQKGSNRMGICNKQNLEHLCEVYIKSNSTSSFTINDLSIRYNKNTFQFELEGINLETVLMYRVTWEFLIRSVLSQRVAGPVKIKTNNNMITLEQIQQISNNEGISKAIDWAIVQQLSHPSKPKTPILHDKNSISEVEQHLEALKQYDSLHEQYKFLKTQRSKSRIEINSLIEQLIKEESGLNSIPEQYRDKVFSKAYDWSHSDGYYAIYNKLEELVRIFDKN